MMRFGPRIEPITSATPGKCACCNATDAGYNYPFTRTAELSLYYDGNVLLLINLQSWHEKLRLSGCGSLLLLFKQARCAGRLQNIQNKCFPLSEIKQALQLGI